MASSESGEGTALDRTLTYQEEVAGSSRELITWLARWRAASGLSQAEIARRMHTSQPAVARLESHQHDAQLSTLSRYVSALGLSMDFTLKDERTEEPIWRSDEDPGTEDHKASREDHLFDSRVPDNGAVGLSTSPGNVPRPNQWAAPKTEANVQGALALALDHPTSDHKLTSRQRKIVQVIDEYLRDHGLSPSNREIAARAGLATVSAVSYQLRKLKAAGIVSYDERRPRTVKVLRSVQRTAGRTEGVGQVSDGTWPQPDKAGGTESEKVAWVPIVGRIAAGGPILAQESGEGFLPLPTEMVGSEQGMFILEVAGDSMIGVGIFPGDRVVVRPLFQSPQNGDIVAATIEGAELEATVKTYKKVAGHVWLLPQNPAYAPIPGDKARFVGKVVAVLRRV
jgi:repressor LexA